MAPPRVLNRLIETRFAAGPIVRRGAVRILLGCRTAAEVLCVNRLDVDRIVRPHEGARGLMVEVAPLPAHVLILLGALVRGLDASLAALLATRDALLAFRSARSDLR